MTEHKYTFERFERRTYVKGRFKGKFIGYLDQEKSDQKHERFFDLEILEGDIYTTQNNITRWTDGSESHDAIPPSGFMTRAPGEFRVTLQYIDGSIKHFRIRLQEISLIRCQLSNQVYKGSEVLGTIEGYVSGYILHFDSIIEAAPLYTNVEEPVAADVEEEERSRSTEPLMRKSGIMSLFGRRRYRSPLNRSGCAGITGVGLIGLFLTGMIGSVKHWSLSGALLLLTIAVLLIIYRINSWLKQRYPSGFMRHLIWMLCLCALVVFTLFVIYAKNDREKDQPLAGTSKEHSRQNSDSFNYYFDEAKVFRRDRKYMPALNSLGKASLFATPQNDKQLVNERIEVLTLQADALVKKGQYKEVIQIYTTLIVLNRTNSVYYYKRAEAYFENGQVPEAAKDLNIAVNMGDRAAKVMRDKINPIERSVRYVTLCNDGTFSNATGSGACSYHGGVKQWNYAVYEDHRKYE